MRVLFIGNIDWASCANRVAASLRAVGVDSMCATAKRNPFGSDEDYIINISEDSWVEEIFQWVI